MSYYLVHFDVWWHIYLLWLGAVVIITFLNHAGPAKVFDIVFFFNIIIKI